jgi:hypothetical protein
MPRALAFLLLVAICGSRAHAQPTLAGVTLAPADGALTSRRVATVGGSVSGDAPPFAVTFLVDGVVESQITGLNAGEPFQHGISLATDGQRTFTLRARDANGRQTTARAGAITLDTAPPAAPILITPQPIVSNQPTITLKGIHPEPPRPGQPAPKVLFIGPPQVRFSPAQPQDVSDPSGIFETKCDVSTLPDGTYTFRLIAIDAAGNFSEASQVQLKGKR